MLPIGTYTPEGRYFLAPMEGVTRTPFRILCRRRGASIVTTDMIDADTFCGIADVRGLEAAIDEQIEPHEEDRPLTIQLGGSNPDTLVRAARILEPYAVIIDLNSGCPTGKTFEHGGGCTLMRDPERLYAIAKAMREAIEKPFTIKLRKGWESPQAIEIAQVLERIGVDGITIHPRTRAQRYSDRADWAYARKLKEALRIPVTLSGDITNASSAREALETTGCDYLMIGRAAKQHPSIFSHLDEDTGLGYGKFGTQPIEDFLEWLELYHASKRYRLSEVRDHALWAVSEAENAKDLKRAINDARDEENVVICVREARFPDRFR